MTDQFEKDASELIRAGLFSGGELTDDAETVPPSLGPYQILRVLGYGGLADVYLARDTVLGREVALKILHRIAPMKMERFVREARVAALLSHPNIVQIFDAGQVEGFHYISMQYIDGSPIGDLSLEPRRAAELVLKVAMAAHYAHTQGIVHRDITPRNILVDRSGTPFLADFGLAKYIDHDTKQLSVTGSVLGTPMFMSPEQARGDVHKLDARTDVYGLGATLYALATGFPPFHEGTLLSVIRQVTDDDPTPPRSRNPALPRDLELIIQMAMEKERHRRYATAEELAKDLHRFLDRLPVVAHPPSIAYRIRRRIARHKAAFITGAIGAAMAGLVAGFFVPRWLEERAAAQARETQLLLQREEQRRSEEALRELATLWGDVLLAKQGWYQAQRDPAETRAALADAVLSVGRFIDRNPGIAQGYYIRARGRVYLEDLAGAREDLDVALRLDPAFAPAWALLGRICIDQYRGKLYGRDTSKPDRVRRVRPLLDQAREAFARSAELGSGETAARRWGLRKMRDDEVAEIVARALAAWYIDNDREQARTILREAQERTPSEEYCNLLGIWEDDARRAIELQTEAIRLMPHFARAYHDRGTRYWLLEDFRQAEEDYTAALRINPRFLPAYVNRSQMRARRGDMAGVIEDTSKAIELDPTVEEAYLNRSYAHQAMNDFDAALRDATEALRLDPQFAEGWVNSSMAKLRLGDFQGALKDAEQAVALAPTLVEAWLDRGAAHTHLGNLVQALADFEKAIELAPSHPEAHFNRGALKATIAGNAPSEARALLKAAESDFLKALEYARPDWPHRTLAETMLQTIRSQLDK